MQGDSRRLHLCLGTQCNNNCLFCMEWDPQARRRRLEAIDTATAKHILSSADARDEIMFTAGEPTLRPDLPELVAFAREQGYRQIGMVTNGRRLAYLPFLRKLVRHGLNYVLISIHGHERKLHEGLTRTPGSFEQTSAGLANVQLLRREGVRLRFATSTVVNRRNLPVLGEHLRFVLGFEPDDVVLNAVQPMGGGDEHFERLVPRATEMAAGVAAALEALGRIPSALRLLDLPRCVTLELPRSVVGFVEEHRHFESAAEVAEGVADGPAIEASSGERLVLVTKEALDGVLRVKGPDCPSCRFFAECEGVWRRYAEAFGFDEFRPVSGASEGADE
jgi:MoaA/NifB/PqqE/SkfB family radical SAM enzyme